MDILAYISITLGILSIYISLKSKAKAKQINHQTELQLMEIKSTADGIYKTADKIEQNMNQQVNRIINSFLPTQTEKLQKEMSHELLQLIYQNPELLKRILK